MIQRVKPSEYLTDIQTMTEVERKDYLERVGEWLADGGKRLLRMTDRPMAQAQNIIQMSTRWTADDCRTFRDGTLLLTALTKVCDTWLPLQLYARSAHRAVRHIAGCFSVVYEPSITGEQKQRIVEKYTKKAMERKAAKEEPAVIQQNTQQEAVAKKEQVNVEAHGCKAVNLVPVEGCQDMPGLNNHVYFAPPVRPKHIDQYVHLLPEKTQERAATVKGLLREMDVARENARRLADAGEHADKIAQWAKAVTRLDEKVKAIYKELDDEWNNLVKEGRVTVDDLGNAHVVAVSQSPSETGNPERPPLTEEEKARVKSLRTSLRDTRGPKDPGEKRDAYVEKWIEKYREMMAIGGKEAVTEAVEKAAEYYGIDLNGIVDEHKND